MNARWIVPILAVSIGSLAAPLSSGAKSHGIYEWGRPVAAGGPGDLPTTVHAINPTQIDAGNFGDVLVMADGSVWQWGGGRSTSTMKLSMVSGVHNVIQRPVDGNGSFAAIEQPGTDAGCPASSSVVEWSDSKAAEVIPQLECIDVVQIARAAGHTFALTASGAVYVWGGGDGNSALGLGPSVLQERVPTLNTMLTALTGGTSIGVEITSGMSGGGILVKGRAWAWGGNQEGQCGCGSTAPIIYFPTSVGQGSVLYASIDEGGNFRGNGHFLAMDTTGRVWAWGDDANGQLGNDSTVNSNLPVTVQGLPPGIVDLRAGGEHSLALDGGGTVWAWGANTFGEIGDGSHADALLPVQVLIGTRMISAGALHSIAA